MYEEQKWLKGDAWTIFFFIRKIDKHPSLSESSIDIIGSILRRPKLQQKTCNEKPGKQELSVPQTEKKHYRRAVDYQTYGLSNRSSKDKYYFKSHCKIGIESKLAD